MPESEKTCLIDKREALIIKVGSSVLTGENGLLDEKVIRNLCSDISWMINEGYKILLVSSGAIAAGLGAMQKNLPEPGKLKNKQALAAVGQVYLMECYQQVFKNDDLQIGQILLSHHDLSRRESFLNTRATLQQLFSLGVLPIVNENDTVATDEIQFGDNDQMAVLLANAIEAGTVIFLSTVAGLIDDSGKKISTVDSIDESILALAKGGNQMGRGGMGSKLMAIRHLNNAGKQAFLCSGKTPSVLRQLMSGEPTGTCFKARDKKMSSKKQWMRHHLRPHGEVYLDEGASKAVQKRQASLLLPGITRFDGQWKVGDLISLCTDQGEFARGMARVSSTDLSRIIGQTKAKITEILGESTPAFMVHKNDIAILDQ